MANLERPRLFGSKKTSGEYDGGEYGKAVTDFRARLEGLKDVPGYPDGSDDAVAAMSLPPNYTATPNPYLRDWIESLNREEREYEDPGPYAGDIAVGKTHPVYKAHSYPTKVPHSGHHAVHPSLYEAWGCRS
ncbi:MAG: hypothetical protein HQ478_13550 [Chloroflexi bacterium]|nr:hypothetical protein [Chloroflexota bacterium]